MRPLLFLLALSTLGGVHANPAPAKPAYNPELSRKLLWLSAGAYAPSPAPCIEKTLHANQKFILSSSSNYTCDHYDNLCAFYITASDVSKEIIVVFRGTKTKRQLLTETWESTQPAADFYGAGKVNKYFFRALNSMWSTLETTLRDPKYTDFKVTFTGHSLGGALASLASMRTVMEKFRRSDQVVLYTFGQPRVGCHKFAMRHDELVPSSFRVVNQKDIVPHLPPCAKDSHDTDFDHKDTSKPCDPSNTEMAYHHGTEVWYPSGMGPTSKYIECLGEPKDEDFHCSDSVKFEFADSEQYVWDHRHYYGHKVVGLGKLGCNVDIPAQQEESVRSESVGSLGAAPGGSSAESTTKPTTLNKLLRRLGEAIGIDGRSGGRAIQS